MIPVKDMSAETTAQALFKNVISVFGSFSTLISDRGSAFSAKIFQALITTFGIKHRMSASRQARSNGAAEQLVKRVGELAKRLCETDQDLEHALPRMELSLRAMAPSRLEYSPYQILFGRHMPIGELGEMVETSTFNGNYENYISNLRTELGLLHKAVKERREEMKKEDEQAYNKRNKVVQPTWRVGETVLLENRKIKPNSDVVLSHKPYEGPFYVSERVQNDPTIGATYRLIEVDSGRSYRYLVNGDRLRPYHARRDDLNNRLPERVIMPTSEAEPTRDNNKTMTKTGRDTSNRDTKIENKIEQSEIVEKGAEPAKRILKQRTKNGKTEFLVEFLDKSCYWCDFVSEALLVKRRMEQSRRRSQNQRRTRSRNSTVRQ